MSDRVEALLHYLQSHSYEQAQKVFPPEVLAEIRDIKGNLTLIFETPEQFKELLISVHGIPYFKGDPLFHPLKGTKIKDVADAPGTFFIRGTPPNATNKFWLTQYPPFLFGEPIGRTVLEFYTEDKITAVFKTDNDNFGGEGSGSFV